MFLEKG